MKKGEVMSTKKHAQEKSFSFRPFENLKKIIGNREIPVSGKPVPAKKEEPINDEEVFLNAMKGVREIKEFREIPVAGKKAAPLFKYHSSDKEAVRTLEEIAGGRRPFNLPDTQEYVEWVNPDYHGEIARKLHKGQFSVQGSVDLHGLIVEEAEAEVEEFIKDALKRRLRCIKIIHGRGLRSPNGPVLKNALVTWLSGRYKKNIIAFVTARQCDGGLGALYILLQ
jgi:DNA-nicking Smr family endonuclease